VLHEGAVPSESNHERADKNAEYKDEKLDEHIRLGLGLGDFFNHFT